MGSVISDEQAESVTLMLLDMVNSEEVAAAHGRCQLAKDHRQFVLSKQVMDPANAVKSVTQKEHYAHTHPEYIMACAEYADALKFLEGTKAKMRNCETVLSVWQTAKRAQTDFDRRMR